MSGRLCLKVCDSFYEEALEICRKKDFTDLMIRRFDCSPPCRFFTEEMLMEILDEPSSECRTVMLLGGSCLSRVSQLPGPDNTAFLSENCFSQVAGETMVNELLEQGAYIVMPTWLEKWRQHVEEWGFTKDLAREAFGESSTSIALLDTGIKPDSKRRLEEFAAFLGLPATRIPVGLDHLAHLITRLVLEWRLNNERQDTLELLSLAVKKAADYEMVFDLLSKLAQYDSEELAVERIMDLFALLFAPRRMVYAVYRNGAVEKIFENPPLAPDLPINRASFEEELNLLARRNDSFSLDLMHSAERLGTIIISGIASPDRIDDYRNVGMAISGVCALAILNGRRYSALEIANTELAGFAHTVSHDIKNPLATIRLASDTINNLLMDGPPGREAIGILHEAASVITGGITRADALINDILMLAEAGNSPVEISEVPINHVAEVVLDELSNPIAERNIKVILDEDLGVLRANPTQMHQVLINLVKNSIQYNTNDDPWLRISRLASGEGSLRLRIEDNGPGIPETSMKKIFVPFVKGKGGSTGIGLSIVDRVVKAYRGTITVRNNPGACFELTVHDAKIDPPVSDS